MKANIFLLALCAFFLIISGCNNSPEVADDQVDNTPKQFPTIKLTTVGLPDLADEIQRLWKLEKGGDIEISVVTEEELQADNFAACDKSDVLIYPSSKKIDLLAANKLDSIQSFRFEDDEFNHKELLRPYRESLVKLNGEWIAISLGEPRPALFYRKDIFAEFELRIPSTWEEYYEVANTIAELREKVSDATQKAALNVCEMRDESGLAKNLTLRAASSFLVLGRYSTFFEFETMDGLINTPPFVRALEQLAENNSSIHFMSAEESYQALINGQATMAITWPAAKWSPNLDSTEIHEPLDIDVVRLPQSKTRFNYSTQKWVPNEDDPILLQGFGGYLVSVPRKAEHSTSAEMFVVWLANKDTSTRLRGFSPELGVTRASHLGSLDQWLGDDLPIETKTAYADIVRSSSLADLRLDWLPIPQSSAYESLLNDAIDKSILDGASPEQVLTATKQSWGDITSKDIDKQRSFYRIGLGLNK